ncbi:Uncharacterised protein [uncultured archaeon]|nr:Uncharacterised protein [uncultured archaeon]
MDSHTVGIYGVLLAVVLVGVVGLYFTSMAGNETSVVYVGGGYSAPQITAWTPPFFSKLAEVTKPFRIIGRGITGMDTSQTGTGTITNQRVFDLRMMKSTIVCNATLEQNVSDIVLFTCNQTGEGAGITCDEGAVTDAASCASTGANDGAFVIYNYGAEGALNATLNNMTLDGVTNTSIRIFDQLFNCTDNDAGKGCQPDCNNCKNTDECEKTIAGGPITECKWFDTSGQCLCECFEILVNNEDVLHQLRNGSTIAFEITKTMYNNSYSSSADCS